MGSRIKFAPCFVLVLAAGGCFAAAEPQTDAAKRARIEAMYVDYKRSFPEVPEVSPEEAGQAVERGDAVLVDVRDPEEHEVSMIPGAITQEAFERNRERYRDQQIITYCTIGYRSGEYAQTLGEAGFDAANMAGSILAWAHAGNSLVSEGEETRRIHVYGPKWNLAPEGYEAVW